MPFQIFAQRLSLALLASAILMGCTASPIESPTPSTGTPSPKASADVTVVLPPSPASTLPAAITLPADKGPTLDPKAQSNGPPVLELARNSFVPGEAFEVRFEASPANDFDDTAWAGILASDLPHGSAAENDLFDLAYAELGTARKGVLDFVAPDTPGLYDVRLFNAEDGREVIYVSFEVTGQVKPLSGNALRLNQSRYRPDALIIVEVSIKPEDKRDPSAWVGIVPAAVPHGDEAVNDKVNLGYQFMGDFLAGKMIFRAPKTPGLYDLRLHDTDLDGKELVFVSFLVVE